MTPRVMPLRDLKPTPLDEQKHSMVRISPTVWAALRAVAKRAQAVHGEEVCPHLLVEGLCLNWLIDRGHLPADEQGVEDG